MLAPCALLNEFIYMSITQAGSVKEMFSRSGRSLEYSVSVDSQAKLGQQTSGWIVVMLFYKRIDTFGLSLPNMQQAY